MMQFSELLEQTHYEARRDEKAIADLREMLLKRYKLETDQPAKTINYLQWDLRASVVRANVDLEKDLKPFRAHLEMVGDGYLLKMEKFRVKYRLVQYLPELTRVLWVLCVVNVIVLAVRLQQI